MRVRIKGRTKVLTTNRRYLRTVVITGTVVELSAFRLGNTGRAIARMFDLVRVSGFWAVKAIESAQEVTVECNCDRQEFPIVKSLNLTIALWNSSTTTFKHLLPSSPYSIRSNL